MIYAYLRISTDKQYLENQQYEILKYSQSKRLVIDQWVQETKSGAIAVSERKLGDLLDALKEGDIVIVSELSRLGRSLLAVMSVLNQIMQKKAKLFSIKEGYELGENISSKVLAFAFGLSAEIERQLISARTKEALQRKKGEGFKLGRPKGSRVKNEYLSGKEDEMINLLKHDVSLRALGRIYRVHHNTISNFVDHLKKEGKL